ncbi:MAG TPA: tRNA lysidine(34) synthetase TilS [Clostridiales bacterium]|nr:tRNA lysidine(34) synthetase TilS [Clostridiales bacterium]
MTERGNMLEDKVLNTIKRYEQIKSGDTIVVGVSGGPDSICLLNVLKNLQNELKINIVVAHINHMIRKEADSETEFVQDFCKQRDIKCFVKKVDVLQIAKEKKLGTEEVGRKIRYDFFEEVKNLVGGNKIATAHNANDNAETVLMNFLRGSGSTGLKGIEPIRDNKLIRPIIECTRQEIEQYCNEKGLNPKYDKTNQESIYTRNKIRNMLIPYIQENFNPNIIETINRMSHLIATDEMYFKSIVKQSYKETFISRTEKEIILDLKKFNVLEKVIKSRLIIYTINELLGTTNGIEKIHIEDVIKLCKNNIGNKYLTPNKNIKIMIKNKKIFFTRYCKLP